MDSTPQNALVETTGAPSAATVLPARDDWSAVVAAYLDLAERRTGSPRTARAYGSAIRAYAAAIGDLGAATPATVHVWAYAPGPTGKTPAASTVIVRLAALRGLYRYAGRVGVWLEPEPGRRRGPAPPDPADPQGPGCGRAAPSARGGPVDAVRAARPGAHHHDRANGPAAGGGAGAPRQRHRHRR